MIKPIAKLVVILTPYGFYSYFVMFALLLAGGFGFPLPEDVVLITGGVLASLKVCNIWIVLVLSFAGILIGDSTMFMIGKRAGPKIQNSKFYKTLLNPRNNERVQTAFQKWGDKVVFMARFMPGLRAPLFISAGMYKVPYWKFFALDGSAAVISVPVWIYLGYLFGANLDELHRYARKFQIGIYSVLGAAILLIVIVVFFKKYLTHRKIKKLTLPDDVKPPYIQPPQETFSPTQDRSQ